MPNFSAAKVLVFGDVMLDRYWLGEASRISPEAPVPVVRVQQELLRAGGAANVAVNMATLGVTVELFGLVGEDQEALQLQQVLQEHRVQSHLLAVSNCPTITKLRVLGQHQQLIRMDFEQSFSHHHAALLQQQFAAQLNNINVVVFSDYGKGALADVQALIKMAQALGITVLVDPKGSDYTRYRGASVITPNAKEFTEVVGRCQSRHEMVQKAQTLIAQLEIGAVLITLGKDGMLLVSGNSEAMHLPAEAQEVFDVTGAGDTVIAVLAATLAAGVSLEEALQFANIAAGIAVKKVGVATVTLQELSQALYPQRHCATGILSESDLLQAIALAKLRGEKVVMTNGCFDILHAGHCQYLQQAKALGDRLVVAVNDDQSVRALKGSQRPLNCLQERMELLAGLRAVDWVVSFSEMTPARLIAQVLPDVLVKGDEYQVSEIAGHEAVLANGGRVQTVPMRQGFSTSRVIAQIQASASQQPEKV